MTTSAFRFEADSQAAIAATQLAAANHQRQIAVTNAIYAARALAEDHRPEAEISRRLQVTRTTVRRWLER